MEGERGRRQIDQIDRIDRSLVDSVCLSSLPRLPLPADVVPWRTQVPDTKDVSLALRGRTLARETRLAPVVLRLPTKIRP